MSKAYIIHHRRDASHHLSTVQLCAVREIQAVSVTSGTTPGQAQGVETLSSLHEEMQGCDVVLVLCSEHAVRTPRCLQEIAMARAMGKHIFGLKVAPCEPGELLSDTPIFDLTDNANAAWQDLWRALECIGVGMVRDFDRDRGRPPYPGLAAFREEDAACFFGRDSDVRAILEALNRVDRFGGAPLVLLVGPPGIGRTSLLHAGVLPRLLKDSRRWLPLQPVSPRTDPIEGFAEALAAHARRYGQSAEQEVWRELLISATAPEDPESRFEAATDLAANLAIVLRQQARRSEAQPVLLLDDMELLLSPDCDPHGRFSELLAAMLSAPGRPWVAVGALRADALGDWQTHDPVVDLTAQYVSVAPLTAEACHEAIVKPAEMAGLRVEPALVDEMVGHATRVPRSMGVTGLAWSLRSLWEEQRGTGALTLSGYGWVVGRLREDVRRLASAVLGVDEAEPAELMSIYHRLQARLGQREQAATLDAATAAEGRSAIAAGTEAGAQPEQLGAAHPADAETSADSALVDDAVGRASGPALEDDEPQEERAEALEEDETSEPQAALPEPEVRPGRARVQPPVGVAGEELSADQLTEDTAVVGQAGAVAAEIALARRVRAEAFRTGRRAPADQVLPLEITGEPAWNDGAEGEEQATADARRQGSDIAEEGAQDTAGLAASQGGTEGEAIAEDGERAPQPHRDAQPDGSTHLGTGALVVESMEGPASAPAHAEDDQLQALPRLDSMAILLTDENPEGSEVADVDANLPRLESLAILLTDSDVHSRDATSQREVTDAGEGVQAPGALETDHTAEPVVAEPTIEAEDSVRAPGATETEDLAQAVAGAETEARADTSEAEDAEAELERLSSGAFVIEDDGSLMWADGPDDDAFGLDDDPTDDDRQIDELRGETLETTPRADLDAAAPDSVAQAVPEGAEPSARSGEQAHVASETGVADAGSSLSAGTAARAAGSPVERPGAFMPPVSFEVHPSLDQASVREEVVGARTIRDIAPLDLAAVVRAPEMEPVTFAVREAQVTDGQGSEPVEAGPPKAATRAEAVRGQAPEVTTTSKQAPDSDLFDLLSASTQPDTSGASEVAGEAASGPKDDPHEEGQPDDLISVAFAAQWDPADLPRLGTRNLDGAGKRRDGQSERGRMLAEQDADAVARGEQPVIAAPTTAESGTAAKRDPEAEAQASPTAGSEAGDNPFYRSHPRLKPRLRPRQVTRTPYQRRRPRLSATYDPAAFARAPAEARLPLPAALDAGVEDALGGATERHRSPTTTDQRRALAALDLPRVGTVAPGEAEAVQAPTAAAAPAQANAPAATTPLPSAPHGAAMPAAKPAEAPPPVTTAAVGATAPPPTRGGPRKVIVAAATGLALVTGALAWWTLMGREDAPPQEDPIGAQEAAAEPAVDEAQAAQDLPAAPTPGAATATVDEADPPEVAKGPDAKAVLAQVRKLQDPLKRILLLGELGGSAPPPDAAELLAPLKKVVLPRLSLPMVDGPVTFGRFSRNTRRLVYGNRDLLWVTSAGNPKPLLRVAGEAVLDAWLTPGGRKLVTFHSGGVVKLRKVGEDSPAVELGRIEGVGPDSRPDRVAMARDGSEMLTQWGVRLDRWPLGGEGQPTVVPIGGEAVQQLVEGPLKLMVVTTKGPALRIWQYDEKFQPNEAVLDRITFSDTRRSFAAAVTTPDTRTLITVAVGPEGQAKDGSGATQRLTITTWNRNSNGWWTVLRTKAMLERGDARIAVQASISNDGKTGMALVEVTGAGQQTPGKRTAWLFRDTDWVSESEPGPKPQVGPQGRKIVRWLEDGGVALFPTDGRQVALSGAPVSLLAFSQDGMRLLTGHKDGTASGWEPGVLPRRLLADQAVSEAATDAQAWKQAIDKLQEGVKACLGAPDRQRLLGESETDAVANYATCMGSDTAKPTR